MGEIMEKEELLKKINKELKVYVNESTFISLKCRNKILKILGEEFSINLPLENFKTIDVTITKDGSIVMRGEEYKSSQKLTTEDIMERYEKFVEKADAILKRKEINYYNMNDKNNLINILLLLLIVVLFITLVIYAIKSFLIGNYFNCIWLFAFMSSWLVPGIRDRLEQAVNFIKRKFRKQSSDYFLVGWERINANIDEIELRDRLIEQSLLQHGKPYEHGMNGFDTFDCAGLVWYVYNEIFNINLYESGFGLSTTTKIMTSKYGRLELFDEESLNKDLKFIKKGDILFFHRQSLKENYPTENNKFPGHCGIYLGKNRFIHASKPKDRVVVSDFTKNDYWLRVLVGSKNVCSECENNYTKILK